MIIKKFQGKTEDEAMEAAKKELGNGVVVMNVKQVKRKGLFSIFKPQMVEVTVALEEEPVQSPAASVGLREAVEAVSQIAKAEEEKNIRERVAKAEKAPVENPSAKADMKEESATVEISHSGASLASAGAHTTAASENKFPDLMKQQLSESMSTLDKEENSNISFFKLLYRIMLENEVDEKYANQLIDDLDKTMKPGMPVDYMLSSVYQKMILKFGQTKVISPAQKGPKVVFFIGPTGVGKTTTIAKLASKFRVMEKKKTALLTADTYRIAAAEQLRTYASILEVPFRVIYTPQEIATAIEDFKDYDYILVDTAGHSHHNEAQRESMSALIHALDFKVEKEVYLVVSATTKYRDLLSIADTYKNMTEYQLIFTKLDETTTFGNLLNLRLHTDAAMSYITVGQNVPDDIAEFDAQETVKMLLGGNHM